MPGYESYVQNIGIPFRFHVSKETKKLAYRDLTGPEQIKLLNNKHFATLLPNSDKSAAMQEIWDGFRSITDDLKRDFKLVGKKDVTPY